MEWEFVIPLGGDVIARAKRDGDIDGPTVVFAHGLCDSMDDPLPTNVAHHLPLEGYSVVRFNFYDTAPRTRRLAECTLAQHAGDLDRVVEYCYESGADEVYAMGHSFGGLATLMSPRQEFKGAVLLEPSHPVRVPTLVSNAQPVEGSGGALYRLFSDETALIGRAMMDEARTLDPDVYMQDYETPSVIINARDNSDDGGEGLLVAAGEEYEARLQDRAAVERYVLPGDHNFTDEAACLNMLHCAVQWLDRARGVDARVQQRAS